MPRPRSPHASKEAPFAPPRKRKASLPLTADQWADAALVAIGRVGVGALSVESLSAHLGVTKGSFYWHYADRKALIERALQRWEHLATDVVIEQLEALTDPADQLRQLFHVAFSGPLHIEVAIMASADQPLAAVVIKRVSAKRLDFLRKVYARMGLSEQEAHSWSLHAYSGYLGIQHVLRILPSAFGAEQREAYARHLGEHMVPPRSRKAGPRS